MSRVRDHHLSAALAATLFLGALPGQIPELIKDINPGPASGMGIPLFAALGPEILFIADDGVCGFELWKTDGTTEGTVMVKDINPGLASGRPGIYARLGGALLFTADDGTTGRELWRTDGTTGGTSLVLDVLPGSGSGLSSLTEMVTVGDEVFFVGITARGPTLWKTDGTAAGTVLVPPISIAESPSNLTAYRGRLFFTAQAPGGFELWVSDGTAVGTYELKVINQGGLSSSPRNMTVIGDHLWFTATNRGNPEVWRTDGTEDGTVLVKSFVLGGGFSEPREYTELGGFVLFAASDGVTGDELWRSDGTPAGTMLVKDIHPTMGSFPDQFTRVGGVVVFEASDGVLGIEPYVTDGTTQGTGLLKDILPGSGGSTPLWLFETGVRHAFFSGIRPAANRELWRTDGTPSGTVQFAEIDPNGSGSPRIFALLNGELLFTARDGATGTELWKVFPGATSVEVGEPCSVNALAPRLSATDPAWQTTWTIQGLGFTPGTTAWVLSSFPVTPSSLGPCSLFVDANAFAVFHVRPVIQPNWGVSLPLPTLPALLGLSVVLQAVQGPTEGPLGVELSNAVVSTFGG